MIEWNGRSLQGKTFEEVYDIIAESRQEPQVELIVFRTLADGRRRHTHAGIAAGQPGEEQAHTGTHRHAAGTHTPASPPASQVRNRHTAGTGTPQARRRHTHAGMASPPVSQITHGASLERDPTSKVHASADITAAG